jgi:putative nucleotidyltransferase-like protein/methyltransferase family protein
LIFPDLKIRNPAKMSLAMSLDPHRAYKLRPELELILCCARTRLDETAAGRVRALLRGELNWSDVVATAFQHHVASFLYQNLRLTPEELVPTVWLDSLRQYTRESSGLALLLLSELLCIHEIFEAERLPLIPYKGPVLSWLAYRALTGRTFIDLDFVTKQEYIPRATSLLKGAGFTAAFAPQEELAGSRGPAPGQYAFFRESSRAQVELHTEQTLRYFPVPLDFDKMSRRFITVEIAGRKMRTFSVEDTLVMLCVHGTKHFWDRLAWIVDVAELVAAQPVDWEHASRIAAEMKSTRVFLLGLLLAHEWLGAALPQPVLERAQRDAAVRWLAEKVRAQFEGNADASPGAVPRSLFRLRSRDSIGQGMRHLLRLTLSPTERDRQTTRLPRFLAPLYVVLRPWRLLREYGLGFRRRLPLDLPIYDPTPLEVVEEMLHLASFRPGDVLYDLGCGDGRIVVAAAEKYGIRAVGVDINPQRIAEAQANARRHGVESLVRFRQEDARKAEISDATVVMIYLGADENLRLAERLRSELSPGARIVSRNFRIYGWTPDRLEKHVLPNGTESSLYLWRIRELSTKGPAAECSMNSVAPSKKDGS